MQTELNPVGVRQAKAQFSALTQEVNATGLAVTVMRNNKPWVVISPAEPSALERRKRLADFKALTAKIESYSADPDWGLLELDRELLAQERAERFG